MILKASARVYGRELALHLMNAEDNEHVELIELRGFVSDDLIDAFQEAEALCQGTRRTRKYLFSLSMNPPEYADVSRDAFEATANRVEAKLGLTGQPRAMVLHDKSGRLHAHVVWSRIDAETMTAKPLPYFKLKLMDIAHDLYLEHEWTLPNGLRAHGAARAENYDLAEAQQSKRVKRDPEALKAMFQSCWNGSDSLGAFQAALREHGFGLARGDRRAFVAIDTSNEVYSLSRWCGMKKKELEAKLGNPDDLPDIETVRSELIAQGEERKQQDAQRRANELRTRIKPMLLGRTEMIRQHRAARQKLTQKQNQRAESEAKERSMRFARGLGAVWQFVTGKRARLKQENETDLAACKARDQRERENLGSTQRKERRTLEIQIKARLRKLEEIRPDQARRRTQDQYGPEFGPSLQ